MSARKIPRSGNVVPNGVAGAAIDRYGGMIYDPSANVLSLVEAAVTRLNDLRDAGTRRADELRAVDNQRIDDLRLAESRRVDEIALLRADYQDKLALAESKRIDAIRSVDVGAVAVASERATQQATVLANQVTTSADALRTLVATTAAAMAAQSQNMTTQFTDRLALLEKSQYETKGRAAIGDPQMERLAALVEKLATKESTTTGQREGISMTAAAIMGIVTILSGLAGIGAVVYSLLKP